MPEVDGIPTSEGQSGINAQLDRSEGEDKENQPESEGDEDDDGGGWITPSNIGQVKMDSTDWMAPADVKVGCVTTDFAMQVRRKSQFVDEYLPHVLISWSVVFQNVLIQIGLHVLSLNGMLIKQARNYILRCHACFK